MTEKHDTYRQWFQDIEERIAEAGRDNLSYFGWTVSARELLKTVYGEHSSYFCEFRDFVEAGLEGAFVSIFLSAKRDFDRCYNTGDIHLRISGGVLGDLVALAKSSLEEGHKEVSAVLAAAALEDVLKRYATSNDIATEDRTMTEIISALKSKSLVNRGASRLLEAMPKIRNLAFHAEWDKLSEVEIGSVIACVEQFLLKHFAYSRLF